MPATGTTHAAVAAPLISHAYLPYVPRAPLSPRGECAQRNRAAEHKGKLAVGSVIHQRPYRGGQAPDRVRRSITGRVGDRRCQSGLELSPCWRGGGATAHRAAQMLDSVRAEGAALSDHVVARVDAGISGASCGTSERRVAVAANPCAAACSVGLCNGKLAAPGRSRGYRGMRGRGLGERWRCREQEESAAEDLI